MESAVLADRAGRFIDASDPMVILGLPGCVPIAQNPAHNRMFGRDSGGLPCLKNRAGYVQLVQRYLGDLVSELANALRCYCDSRDAVLALRAEECVFEYCFKLFGRFRSQQDGSFKGFEFLFEKKRSRGPVRAYSIWRVHSRLLGRLDRVEPDCDVGLIEARLVEAKGLHLVVRGSRNAGLESSLQTLEGRVVSAIHPLRPSDAHSMYLSFEHDIDKSLGKRGDELTGLRETAANFRKETFLYPALQSIIGRLETLKPGKPLRDELSLIRARLWDGPLVANAAQQELERQLAEGALEEDGVERLRDPLPLLESADRFVGIGPPRG